MYIPILSFPLRINEPVFFIFNLVVAEFPIATIPFVPDKFFPAVTVPELYICCVCPLDSIIILLFPVIVSSVIFEVVVISLLT